MRWILLGAMSLLVGHSVKALVKSYKRVGDAIEFVLDTGCMRLDILSPDVVRVRYTSLAAFADKKSLVVVGELSPPPDFRLSEDQGMIRISTNRLTITVNRLTNAVTYANAAGQTILAEADNQGKSMTPTRIVGIDTYQCTTRFTSPPDEALFGLGCHPLDTLSINYKGRDQHMLIKYLTGAIPVLLSTRGYGLLWDNYAASDFYGTDQHNTEFRYVSESGKMTDYYFFFGPSFDHIIDSYRDLTGRAPMYPKWVYGLFQSQDRYKSQAEILSVKNNYRNNHIPVDAIVQDWYWWAPLPIGAHVMNADRYPDPKKMIDELHHDHVHAMISIWPVFGSGTADYTAMQKMGGLTTITWDNFVTHTFDTYYDAHNPAARALYWAQARDSVVKRYGWDAWWVDQCEPDNGELLDERRKAVFYTGKGIDYFNSYALEHVKGLYKGWRSDIPGKRAYFLIRQAFAGSQGSGATLWSSDVNTTFASLKNQVPQAINACVSGIPYWTSDIGGYISRVDPEGIPDWSKLQNQELFIRWFQFGVFCPIFRIHGKGERALFSNNWNDHTKAILLKYDQLRYRLLPYIYSLAGKVTQENYTPLRALAFDFRTDTAVYHIQDQYMYGPAFLVNPVTAAATSTRPVYLPKGTDWINFWTGDSKSGGQLITADAPLDVLPLYVRAGSIVPVGPMMEYATQKPADTIELRVYPGADGHFTYYEDENDGYHYEQGKFATIQFNWVDKTRILTISDTKGSFPGMLAHRVFNVVVVRRSMGVGAEPARTFDTTIAFDNKQVSVVLPGTTSTGTYTITDFGAVKDANTVCTKSLQAAIDACAADGGGVVIVPEGIFLTGTVHLKSNVELHLDPGAVLKGSTQLSDYDLDVPEKPYQQVHKGMIFTEDADNVSITGEGHIDGNGDAFFDTTIAKRLDSATIAFTRQKYDFRHVNEGLGDGPIQPKERPYQMIVFSSCRRVTVKDVFITRSPFWCLHLVDCDAVHISGIRLWTNMLAPNADGIDVTSCSNVIIDGCDIRTGDDALNIVGFNHHYEVPGFRHLRHFSGNIIISNCNLQSNSSGIRIGYEDQNTLQNVRVSNVNITNSSRGIGIFLRDEGSLKNLIFTNIYIQTRIPTGDWWGNGEPIHISAIRGKDSVVLGTIENVQFNNVICQGDAGMIVYGSDESVIKNVSFKNITFELVDTRLNEVAGGNIDLRGAKGYKNSLFASDIPGLLVDHVDGLTIDDFTLVWTHPRMSFLTNGIDIKNFNHVRIDHFQGTGAPNNPGTFPVKASHGTDFQTDLAKDKVLRVDVK